MTSTLKIQASMITLFLAFSSAPQIAHAADEDLPSSVLQQQAFERGVQVGLQQGQALCAQQTASQPRAAAPKSVVGQQFICEEIFGGRKVGNVVRTTLYSDGTSVRAIVAQAIPVRNFNGFRESCEAKAEALNTGR